MGLPNIPNLSQAQADARYPALVNRKVPVSNVRHHVPSRINLRQVMASPPATTLTTAHTIASPRFWAAVSYGNPTTVFGGSSFTYLRAGNPRVFGSVFPDYKYLQFGNIQYGPGDLRADGYRVAFMHDGSELEIAIKGSAGYIRVKIDDRYISLTPTTVPSNGSDLYYYIPLGSSYLKRVDVEVYNSPFAGVYTGPTDTIFPAPVRGPRTLVLGDSFTEGSGSSAGTLNGWVYSFADSMNWDDVWASGVGGTGYLAAPSPKFTFRQRVDTDVIAFNPEVVIIAGGINDSAADPTALYNEADALYKRIRQALPRVTLIVLSPFWRGGRATMPLTLIAGRDSIKAAAAANGAYFIDCIEQPLPAGFVPNTTTLSANVTATQTSFNVTSPIPAGGTFKFADGSGFSIKSMSGTGPYNVVLSSGLSVGQSAGAVITQVGDCLWDGSGRVGTPSGYGNSDLWTSSDNTHPTDQGHFGIGQWAAQALINTLGPN